MKFIFKIMFLISIIGLFFTSCEKDDDKEDKVYTSVAGRWSCVENGSLPYEVDIETIEKDSIYVISNFHQIGFSIDNFVFADLIGMKLILESATIGDISILDGVGEISSDYKTINFEYTISQNLGDKIIYATYTRL